MKTDTYVISAPSGTGKTSLNHKILENHDEFRMVVSYTSRKRRPVENDGKDYHFVDQPTFRKEVEKGNMLEWAEVFGNLYGTHRQELERIIHAGQVAIIEIDVQGWRQLKSHLPKAQSVFILPPDMKTLWSRLTSRGTDDFSSRWRRLKTSVSEIKEAELYNHFLINDKFDASYQELENIVVFDRKAKLSPSDALKHCRRLIEEFNTADWVKELKDGKSELDSKQNQA